MSSARPNRAWRSSCDSYNLSRSGPPSSSCTHIHFLNHTFLNAHSITLFQYSSDYSFASITEKNLAPPVLLSFTVNPIIQSTSHQTAAARFWCHLRLSKVPRDTGGPWDPRLDALWRSNFQSNGFHLSKPNSFPPQPADLRSHGSFLWPGWL